MKRATCAGGQTVLEDILPNMTHAALRLSFHDAIGFSPKHGGGGADGSIITFGATELNFPANAGLDDAVNTELPFIQAHNVTTGGLVGESPFTSAVSLSLCPGAPKVPFLMGRPLARAPAPGPDGLVPEPFDNVDVILARMADAGGFTATDVVALLASHSVAGADNVDPTIEGVPFDSTPDLFDTQIFIEVQLRGTQFPGSEPGQGEMRLQSDHLIARDPATNCAWQSFAGQQTKMQTAFAKAFNKLATIGHNPANLVDCSDTQKDIEQAVSCQGHRLLLIDANIGQCAVSPFPTFTAQPGPATTVPAM
ncbi:versatile peroxidase [Mycena olivaceomarginata]|nr:versatile peroxidase [Mycena olivaceomarginata]